MCLSKYKLWASVHLQVGNLVRPCFATSYEKNALLSAESSDDYSVTFLGSAERFCCLIAVSLVLGYVLEATVDKETGPRCYQFFVN